jgi:WD40 repeat protein
MIPFKCKCPSVNRRLEKRLFSVLTIAGFVLIESVVFAQGPQPAKQALNIPGLAKIAKPNLGTGKPDQAYIDLLIAREFANDGSKPEALQRLAESLRLQPEDNPAAGLAFELLSEQRTNSRLVLMGHRGDIQYAAYNSDGTKIVTTSTDHTARLWDARTGKQLTAPLQHDDDVLIADFSSDGKRVVTGSEDRTARVWDVETGRPIGLPLHGSAAILSVRFSPDGKTVVTGSEDGKAQIWNVETSQPISPVIRYHESVNSIRFSPDGSKVLVGSGDGQADVLDPRTGARLLKTLRHNNAIFTVAFSLDGNTLLTASEDHTAKIWDAKTGQLRGHILQHPSAVSSAAFNHDATRAVTASWDHTARIWDTKTGQPVTPPLQHGGVVLNATFSPDGNFIATISGDHTARLWDATSGEPVRLPIRAQNAVSAIAFNPRGSSFLVACDSAVQIFDTPPHEAPPSWVADLADFAATQNNYNQSKLPDLNKISSLRTQLLSSKSSDPWSTFGRWYFADNTERPISPWSAVSLQQYVDSLIAQGDKESLDFAYVLSRDHPAWLRKIASLRANLKADAAENAHDKQ